MGHKKGRMLRYSVMHTPRLMEQLRALEGAAASAKSAAGKKEL